MLDGVKERLDRYSKYLNVRSIRTEIEGLAWVCAKKGFKNINMELKTKLLLVTKKKKVIIYPEMKGSFTTKNGIPGTYSIESLLGSKFKMVAVLNFDANKNEKVTLKGSILDCVDMICAVDVQKK